MIKTENKILNNFLENLEQGKKQEFKNMTVIPLFFNGKYRSRYLTLEEVIHFAAFGHHSETRKNRGSRLFY